MMHKDTMLKCDRPLQKQYYVARTYFWLEVVEDGSSPICHFWVITAIMNYDYFTVQNLQFGQRLAHNVQMRAISCMVV